MQTIAGIGESRDEQIFEENDDEEDVEEGIDGTDESGINAMNLSLS